MVMSEKNPLPLVTSVALSYCDHKFDQGIHREWLGLEAPGDPGIFQVSHPVTLLLLRPGQGVCVMPCFIKIEDVQSWARGLSWEPVTVSRTFSFYLFAGFL